MSHELMTALTKKKPKTYNLAINVNSLSESTLSLTIFKGTRLDYGYTETTVNKPSTLITPTEVAIVSIPVPAGTTHVYLRFANPSLITGSHIRINEGSVATLVTGVSYWEGNPFSKISFSSTPYMVSVPDKLWPACTDMSGMFQNCIRFNQALNYNAPNVLNMSTMLAGCTGFNQPVTLIAPKVTNFASMFEGCSNFNQPIAINAPNVVNMQGMFFACAKFNQTLTGLDITKVSNIAVWLYGCIVFNQDLSTMIFKSTVSRSGYDTNTTAWITANKPKFTA